MSVVDCLVKTLDTRNTKIYITKNGNRYLLTECDAKIEVYRRDKKVDIMASTRYECKKFYISIIVCGKVVYKQDITEDYFDNVTSYEIATEIVKENKTEALVFKYIDRIETDEMDSWEFSITNYEDVMKTVNF